MTIAGMSGTYSTGACTIKSSSPLRAGYICSTGRVRKHDAALLRTPLPCSTMEVVTHVRLLEHRRCRIWPRVHSKTHLIRVAQSGWVLDANTLSACTVFLPRLTASTNSGRRN
jgi:hypothetical protein